MNLGTNNKTVNNNIILLSLIYNYKKIAKVYILRIFTIN